MKKFFIIFILLSAIVYYNCGKESTLAPTWRDGIDMKNKTFTLYSTNEGIYPDKSVLDDPNNIFAGTSISDDFKWDIAGLGNGYETAKFYMWATVLAQQPWGEPQYYTANMLENLATIQQSTVLTQQAIRAYQAVLDNWPYDKTDLTGNGDFYPLGVWAVEHIESLGGTPDGYRVVVSTNGDKFLVEY